MKNYTDGTVTIPIEDFLELREKAFDLRSDAELLASIERELCDFIDQALGGSRSGLASTSELSMMKAVVKTFFERKLKN